MRLSDQIREEMDDGNITLLPTPVAQPSGNAPEDHLRKKPGRTVVTDLAIITENGLLASGGKLLPTLNREGSGGDDLTTAIWKEGLHHAASEGRSDQGLQSVRGDADSQAIRERAARRSNGVPEERALLAELREHAGSDSGGLSSVAGAAVQSQQ